MFSTLLKSRRTADPLALVRQALDAMAADDLATATARLSEAGAAAPDLSAVMHATALCALRLAEPGRALEALQRAYDAAPNAREHADVLAIVHAKLGHLHESLFFAKLAVALDPAYPDLELNPVWLGEYAANLAAMVERPLLNEAQAQLKAGDYERAAEFFRKDIDVNRTSAASWRGFALALRRCHRPHEALVAYRALRSVAPETAADVSALAVTFADCGRFEESLACHERAMRMAPDDADLVRAMLADIARNPVVSRADLAARQIAWGRTAPVPVGEPPVAGLIAERPMRVGFLSGRFGDGRGIDAILSLLALPRRPLWEAHCYSNVTAEDGLTRRLRSMVEGWRDISELDDDTAALIIRNDNLDVLIDLDGHSDWGRPRIVPLRPAPRCLAYAGLPEAAPAQGFDGVLGDERLYPTPGEEGAAILRVPGSLFRVPADREPAVSTGPRSGQQVAFGSRAPRGALSAGVVALWADVLHAVPDSILVLDSGRIGGSVGFQEIESQFAWHGVEKRLHLAESVAGQPEGSWNALVDIVLDAGLGTSLDDALDALVHGKPVITLPCDRPQTRSVASLLDGLGFADCVAADAASYLSVAAGMARDPAALAGTARRIVERIKDAQAAAAREGSAGFGRALGAWLNARVAVSP